MSTGQNFKTIRAYSEYLLAKTDYIDCYGRRVGYDYPTILKMIRRRFPKARTSLRSLRLNVYTIDPSIRLPIRRKSRRVLAREYVRALLLKRDSQGIGLNLHKVLRSMHGKFPGALKLSMSQLTMMLAAMRREFRSKVPGARG